MVACCCHHSLAGCRHSHWHNCLHRCCCTCEDHSVPAVAGRCCIPAERMAAAAAAAAACMSTVQGVPGTGSACCSQCLAQTRRHMVQQWGMVRQNWTEDRRGWHQLA
eukprot:scaffold105080_cov18-Tisochrysis_lutea.AAC.3